MRRALLFLALAVAAFGCGGTPAATPDASASEAGAEEAATAPEAPAAGEPDASETEVYSPPPTPSFGANLGPVTTCDVTKPFGPVVPIQGFTQEQDAFAFSNDYLTIYVTSVGTTGNDAFDLFTATRPSLTAPFGTRTHLDATGGGDDRYPVLTSDELTLYYVWQTESVRFLRRKAATDVFEATSLGIIEDLTFVDRVWVSRDQKRIYYSTGSELWLADLAQNPADPKRDKASNPRKLANVNTGHVARGPVLTGDELTLYFTSNLTAGGNDGLTDIFVAHRAKTADDFGPPQPVAELNTAEYPDHLLSISPEGCTAYLRRQMGGDLTFHVAVRGK